MSVAGSVTVKDSDVRYTTDETFKKLRDATGIDWKTAGMRFFQALQDQVQEDLATDAIPEMTQRMWTSDLQLPQDPLQLRSYTAVAHGPPGPP